MNFAAFDVGFADVDMVAISLVRGNQYTIDVENGRDYLLRVFDAFGHEVMFNNDGNRSTDDIVNALSPYANFVPNYSGTYYVALSPYYLSTYDPATTSGRVSPENPMPSGTTAALTITDLGVQSFPGADAINAITAESTSDLSDHFRNTGRQRMEMAGTLDSVTDVDIARFDLTKGDILVVDVNGE